MKDLLATTHFTAYGLAVRPLELTLYGLADCNKLAKLDLPDPGSPAKSSKNGWNWSDEVDGSGGINSTERRGPFQASSCLFRCPLFFFPGFPAGTDVQPSSSGPSDGWSVADDCDMIRVVLKRGDCG